MSSLSTNEIVTLGVSFLALVVSGYAAFQYRKANSLAAQALAKSGQALDVQKASLALAEATLENQLQVSIASALDKVQQAGLALSNKKEEDADYGLFKQAYRVAQENWLNAYDQACISYLEGKINKATFKRTYHVQIRNVMKEFGSTSFFSPANLSPYQSILKCFDEWEVQHQ
ncbi:hypothetical protein QPR65_22365 (plasmid) [Enterobacter hormaechei]|uniref:hypothetical protein n=1 Tax=Enterobacter hormaechei TaxID=158836 RepID=UPI0027D342CA|nr:hypothetical protein [Enterobacter hormaechei]WLZ51986.1 hypothetical protein QPR65_22365 [Enterobacter hormaechei]